MDFCCFCRYSLISAVLPAHRGAAALVPPTTIQPLDGQPAAAAVQYIEYPLAGSASAETSGTSRLPLLYWFCTPGPVCQLGSLKKLLRPPPPPAPWGLRWVSLGLLHTDSLP